MESAEHTAVAALKQAKSEGLSYYDATQSLLKQGYSQQDIEQAAYQFTYNDPPADGQDAAIKLTGEAAKVFGETTAREQTLEYLRKDRDDAIIKAMFLGRFFMPLNIHALRSSVDYHAAKNGVTRSKTYGSIAVAWLACLFILPIAGTIVTLLHLNAYFIFVFFAAGLIGVSYIFGRYMRRKTRD